jgi:hypothetical protein
LLIGLRSKQKVAAIKRRERTSERWQALGGPPSLAATVAVTSYGEVSP